MPRKKAKKNTTGKTTRKAEGRQTSRSAGAEACCTDWEKKMESRCRTPGVQHCGGFAYFLGFIGSAVYYIMNATGFWNGVLGVIKALVWPAFLVFELMKFLGM